MTIAGADKNRTGRSLVGLTTITISDSAPGQVQGNEGKAKASKQARPMNAIAKVSKQNMNMDAQVDEQVTDIGELAE